MPRALDAFAVVRDVAVILRVARAHAADRADAHAVQIRAGFGRVALKIAVQRALALGHGQFVIRAREVVHADVLVSGVQKIFKPGAENSELFHAFGQASRQRALLLA